MMLHKDHVWLKLLVWTPSYLSMTRSHAYLSLLWLLKLPLESRKNGFLFSSVPATAAHWQNLTGS